MLETEVYYEMQALTGTGKRKGWEGCMAYPADTFTQQHVTALTAEQRLLAGKPLRSVKVTITTEVIEVFE